MSNETVIDLGLDRWPPEEQEPPVDLRRVWARRRRPLVSAVCAALLLGTLAAAAPPPSPGLTLVAQVHPTNGFFINGDYLVVYTGAEGASVYRLSTKEHLWSGPNLYLGDSPDVLYSQECPGSGLCDEPETVVWDIATGARLGTLPSGLVPGTGLRLVASGYREVPVRDSFYWFGVISRPDRIEARDATGAVRWSVDSPDWLDYLVHTEDGVPVVVVYGESTVEVRDAATGVVSSRYRLPDPDESILSVTVAGGLLLTTDAAGDDTVVRAFEWDTLRPRWQHRWAGIGWIGDCGALLCYARADTESHLTTVLDPATGATLWSSDEPLVPVGLEHPGHQLFLRIGPRGVAHHALILVELVVQEERVVPPEFRLRG